jgi:hypothetical protein
LDFGFKALLSLPEVSLQFPVESPIQERYGDPEDDLKFQGRFQARETLALLIVGDVRRGLVSQQAGHVFLGEAHPLAVNPELVLGRGAVLPVSFGRGFCFAHDGFRIGNFRPPGKEGEVAS